MKPTTLCLVLVIALVVLGVGSIASAAAEPPGRYDGTLNGADYLINVPDGWNGGLVMLAHGYQGEATIPGLVETEPL